MYDTRGQHNIKTHLHDPMIANEELNIPSTSDLNYNVHCFYKRHSKVHGVI